jgi:hypothetical protein
VGGLEVFKKVSELFKRKRSGEKTDVVDNAISVLEEFGQKAQGDPEAVRIIQDHALEMEREYTKQAQAALEVMNTEAASGDKWVRRSRPTLMYIAYLILLSQLIIFPIAGIKLTEFIDKEIVYWFYWMFSSGYLGYGVLRSVDKTKGGLPAPINAIGTLMQGK